MNLATAAKWSPVSPSSARLVDRAPPGPVVVGESGVRPARLGVAQQVEGVHKWLLSPGVETHDAEAALRYHEQTKHSLESLRRASRGLDWANQPLPYKDYPTLPPMALPTRFAASTMSALDATAGPSRSAGHSVPNLETLARLCHFSNGVLRRRRHAGGEIGFRAAACTGALYHIELYLVVAKLPGLAAGVYHFGAHDDSLRRLRSGDHRGALVEATAGEPAIRSAPVIVVLTSTFWRNAWKYQTRAYRHSYWDAGTILANLLACAAAARLPTRVVLGFVDSVVNDLLDVDGEREAAVALIPVGSTLEEPPPAPPRALLGLPTARLSPTEVDYPGIRAVHRASCLSSPALPGWRASYPVRPPEPAAGHMVALPAVDATMLPDDPIETVIRRRGSTRRFSLDHIGIGQLTAIVDRALATVSLDCIGPLSGPLSYPYLIAHAVDGLAPGAYYLHRSTRELERLRTGSYRQTAGRLALGQELAAEAAVNVYFLADLDAILGHFGNRGYRLAQLHAAIAAGRIYLAAYALGLGATGLTFFDDDVTEFFAPHAKGRSVMFLIAVGKSLKRERRPTDTGRKLAGGY
jgi:SagB-type dehydrogenase family enzyme